MHQGRVRYLASIIFGIVFALVVSVHLSTATLVETDCHVPSGYHTIQLAIDDPSCTVIQLSEGVFDGGVVVSRTLTIEGQGPSKSLASGPAAGTVFTIEDSGTLTITGLAIANGATGIYNDGRLLLDQSTVRDNNNGGGLDGGGIVNQGTMTITLSNVSNNVGGLGAGVYTGDWLGDSSLMIADSTLDHNRNVYGGGGLWVSGSNVVMMRTIVSGNEADTGAGIYVDWGSLTVSESTISNNTASNAGGGLHNMGNSDLLNVTFSGNIAMKRGGGLLNNGYRGEPWGNMLLRNVTITGNYALEGGGIQNSGTLTMTNSIVANSLTGIDCLNEDSFEDGGHNLVEDGSCTTEASSLSGDPKLLPLGDNGGPTPTSALFLTSPAIDTGNDSACPATDQRGVARPLDGDKSGQAQCDIGAFEYDGPGPPAEYVYLPLITTE